MAMVRASNNINPKCVNSGDKKIVVVDDHQYALLAWAKLFQKTQKSCALVSIDYHPDTNPPFWLYAYQKAMAIDPEREVSLVSIFQQKILASIDPADIKSIELVMEKMRNDEQINTAMSLGYLKNYHMINCMEKHQYETGHHYLVEKENFGSLGDNMFKEIKFSLDTLGEEAYILDIDLDYFSALKNFQYQSEQITVFKKLVQGASLITIARSATYFDYLKEDDFSIEECEDKLITLITSILNKNRLK